VVWRVARPNAIRLGDVASLIRHEFSELQGSSLLGLAARQA